MTSAMRSRGTRRTRPPITSASSRAGMMRVTPASLIALLDGRQHGGAGAPDLEEIAPRPRRPLEIHPLAAHQRTVGVGFREATGELAATGAPSLALGHERAIPAGLRHLARPGELRRGEHALGAEAREIRE